jgi:signal transduction histidine kinase
MSTPSGPAASPAEHPDEWSDTAARPDGPPWGRGPFGGRAPGAEERARHARRVLVFAAVVTGLVQLPGLGLALAALHRGGADAAFGVGATVSGLVASALLLLPWRGAGAVIVAVVALPAIALAPAPPLAGLALAVALARAVIADAAAWAWATLAGMVVVGVTFVSLGGAHSGGIRLIVVTVLLCLATGITTGARSRRERFRAAAQQQAARRRSAAEEERLRIARELHDVLAHSLSQISVQAGVGLHLFDDEPERAKEALRSIRETSTTALDDVRGVLGMLRGDRSGDDTNDPARAAPRMPAPTLAAVPGLLSDARATGLDVSARGEALVAEHDRGFAVVPVPVQTAAYRIVQESLTNVRRHAPGSPVVVTLEITASEVLIQVVNAPPGSAMSRHGEPPHEPGRGILGMRERAEAFGGTLRAAATSDGGFDVHARLPYRPTGTPVKVKETPS